MLTTAPKFTIERIIHRDEDRIAVRFPYDAGMIQRVKAIPGSRWSATLKCWHVPDNAKAIHELGIFNLEEKPKHQTPSATIVPEADKNTKERDNVIQRYKQHLTLRSYSANTQRNYLHAFSSFLSSISPKHPNQLKKEDILQYMQDLIHDRKPSESYQNLIINAIKFWYEQVENLPRTLYELPRPKNREPLPKVLSLNEVTLILKKTENLKHRSILMLAYGAGLRLSEIIGLKLTDINSQRMIIRVNSGKGKKDRELTLPDKLLLLLREYVTLYKPKEFLFEGQDNHNQYTSRSAQQVIKQAALRAGIKRTVTMHMLRHSYATHLLESGTDIRYIQEALGHESIRTTEIYTHVAKDRKPASPLDTLDL